MKEDLSKIYNSNETEEKIYKFWEDKKYFKSQINKNKKPYTIMMPPPNITGNLHMGHAFDATLQDILIRFKRMKGFEVLWQPGTDHAAIATEVKIVEDMQKEGLTKETLGYDGFIKRAFKWKEKYGNNIVNQIKKLGSSCDWSRERFTMDEGCSKTVKEFFIRLYEKGLIYRGERIINWCPECQTTISDIEVEFEEKNGKLYYVKYPLADGNGYLEVATTRPETIPGDVALAINPEDDRAKGLIGKTVRLPIFGREISIITDEAIEKDFGTGVLKVTPAHSVTDFEIGERHSLKTIDTMDNKGVLNENASAYAGMDRFAARKAISKDLEEQSYISKIEDIRHNVGTCYRCGTVIEPRISKQWFVKMKPLAGPAIESVKNGEIKFVPERFSKIYFSWMENIKDWCISRQIWWGHKIPASICNDCGEIIVSREEINKCSKCDSKNINASEETLDTWFSSALWPFSTLGWPEKTPEFEYFYPTDVLVTGYDIIFFWVARMIFSALEMTNKKPFKSVIIHGLIRDAQGRKMSKSLGNGIDPLEMIKKYGADALRFSIVTGNSPGNDIRFSVAKIEPARNFANKIWNAARFIHMMEDKGENENSTYTAADKWILSKFNKITKEINNNLEKFEFGLASAKIYDFLWSDFCDWYIEFSKISLNKKVLIDSMCETLKLLHPFMPFITEEIWQSFPQITDSIVISQYPEFNENLNFDNEEKNIENLIEIIRGVRNKRTEMNVPQNKKTMVHIESKDDFAEFLKTQKDILLKFTFAKEVIISKKLSRVENAVEIATEKSRIYLPLDELVNMEAEQNRIQKEIKTLEKQLEDVKARLSNSEFITKAPKNIIDGAKNQMERIESKLAKLRV